MIKLSTQPKVDGQMSVISASNIRDLSLQDCVNHKKDIKTN